MNARRAAVVATALGMMCVGGWFATASHRHADADATALPDGGEIFAIDPSMITELGYEKGARKLVARRPATEASFDIEVSNGGKVVEQCVAARPFNETLAALASIRVKRVLEDAKAQALQASRAADFATLRISDATVLEPQRYQVLSSAPGGPIILVEGPTSYESTVPSTAIEGLEAGCSALGVKH